MSAYIASLNREMEVATRGTSALAPSLRERLIGWHASLPEVSRQRPFAMAELESALGSQGKDLSSVLIGLGWVRRRKWSTSGQYSRYWVPPLSAMTSVGVSAS